MTGKKQTLKITAEPADHKRAATKTAAAPKSANYVYIWGADKSDGIGDMKPLLGRKGASLAEMALVGLPVPPGLTITTEACAYYHAHRGSCPVVLEAQVKAGLANIEKIMGCEFGDAKGFPLLVAVRSGSRDRMPGMMDTILNLGLNDDTVQALAAATNNERFAWDCYRRFIQMYGDVVMGVQKRDGEEHEPFETVIDGYKHEHRGESIIDSDLSAADNKELVKRFKDLVRQFTGKTFPTDPWEQLMGAVGAAFRLWMNDRAIAYRRKRNISDEWGTAVSVQAMVYGNTGETSGSGVAFTRNPASGTDEFYGEFLTNAQGEDVVAGVRPPEPVNNLKKRMPKSYAELLKVRQTLEKHFKDMQDIEFTIQDGKVFLLQTRNARRTATAALKIPMDMVKEGLIDWETAVLRVPADQLDQLLAPIIKAKKSRGLAKGVPACPGAASGKIYLNIERAVAAAENGEKVLLVCKEVSYNDLCGMDRVEGILTTRGGIASIAALMARQLGKACVCGASAVAIDYDKRTVTLSGETFHEGDLLSIDGTSGIVYAGDLVAPSEIVTGLLHGDKAAQKTEKYKNFLQLMTWCAKATRMRVRTSADTAEQVAYAMAFGATGIGLTRTENMFFEGDRIESMREMILATNEADRRKALAKLMPYQRADFVDIFKTLNGLPVVVRLLDPPLHEFLPHAKEQQLDLSEKLGIKVETIQQQVAQLHEFNPMLGHRGCRLGIVYPEIIEMQARAIFEAAAEVSKLKIKVLPQVLIPMVGFKREFDLQVEIVHRVAREVMAEKNLKIAYHVGALIEVPRSALTADEIAQTAEFFSFDTNDLTQTALGISRDDMGSFLMPYIENEVFKKNPFDSLDTTGVGQLMEIAVAKGRQTRPDLELGICGEHGGDPDSIKFCHKLGLDYVSCPPYRVPIARLAAAQAAIEDKRRQGIHAAKKC